MKNYSFCLSLVNPTYVIGSTRHWLLLMISYFKMETCTWYYQNWCLVFKELTKEEAVERASDTPPVIINAVVSTTLRHLMDLIFRDFVEPALADVILPDIDSITQIKYHAELDCLFKI